MNKATRNELKIIFKKCLQGYNHSYNDMEDKVAIGFPNIEKYIHVKEVSYNECLGSAMLSIEMRDYEHNTLRDDTFMLNFGPTYEEEVLNYFKRFIKDNVRW